MHTLIHSTPRMQMLVQGWMAALLLFFVSVVSIEAQSPAEPTGVGWATIEDLNAAFDSGELTAERLIEMSLTRIEAYDQAGPELHAMLWLNDNALERARELDDERRRSGPRSLLHGIPVVLKDNVDTGDMPTTGGSALLAGAIPPDDAFIVKKLRDAGAIILAKTALSELASGGILSSLGNYFPKNPHDPARTPSGSSTGAGIAVAASFAQLGVGTDTGGSIRGPATDNGIVALRPSHGLVSHDGIIPLSITLDMAGPMGRHVYDVAAMLGVMTGIDPADPTTRKSEGRFETDYTQFLDAGALEGARIGIARDFMGEDDGVNWVIEAALGTMRAQGATVVDVRFPPWLLAVKGDWYFTVRYPEFRSQIEDYLATIGPEYPKTLREMIERSDRIVALMPDGSRPNPVRWNIFREEEAGGELTDYQYVAMREHGFPMVQAIVHGMLDAQDLDAIVYPPSNTPPARRSAVNHFGGMVGTNIASLAGLPDLIVPAGFTRTGLPVGISFLGRAFSEARLFALGYAFEQATRARRDPIHTPALPGEHVPRPAGPGGR
ncbi:MAG: amidase family protein [Gammaproteobacteria bacterium]|nr:amidase family protein [Gammaproteobacteria bacterium]